MVFWLPLLLERVARHVEYCETACEVVLVPKVNFDEQVRLVARWSGGINGFLKVGALLLYSVQQEQELLRLYPASLQLNFIDILYQLSETHIQDYLRR